MELFNVHIFLVFGLDQVKHHCSKVQVGYVKQDQLELGPRHISKSLKQ